MGKSTAEPDEKPENELKYLKNVKMKETMALLDLNGTGIDSGVINHITSDVDHLYFLNAYIGTDQVAIGNGKRTSYSAYRPLSLTHKSSKFLLNNVLHVPSIDSNLLSSLNTTTKTTNTTSYLLSFSPPPPAVISPCVACKFLRRRCVEKCVLAPYFPPTEPLKFKIAHKVYGASSIIKFLLEIPEAQRADAVSSMVYEATARIRDPVYGCVGLICQLQKQVQELQEQLAKAQAELINMQFQQANLFSMDSEKQQQPLQLLRPRYDHFLSSPPSFNNNASAGSLNWEPDRTL
ncbi:hypothetical protein HHK36_011636 [Tetracentron sinense]|uniref:LOB domain-containing protein n=1 Tax=Tetracentron sinense TaxID=13715 RepID=A0A835DK21_TETSI|nr:hypothetical protein HHK36_011636 [Tetracentron sinense]